MEGIAKAEILFMMFLRGRTNFLARTLSHDPNLTRRKGNAHVCSGRGNEIDGLIALYPVFEWIIYLTPY